MSETYSLEEGGTPPPDVTPEPVAETPPPAPEAPPAAPADPDAVDVGGQRMVPLAALSAAREENRTLKQKAEQYDQVAAQWHAAAPYIEFLKNNPDLLKPRETAPPAPPPQAAPEDDAELVTLARTLDLYTADGKPDAKRAAALASFVDKRADGRTQEAVKPLHEQSVQERANTKFREALAVEFNGMKPNPQVLQQIWRTTDPKVLATDQGAAAAVLMAMGMGAAMTQPTQQPTVQPPTAPPVVTEPAGGRGINRPAISEFEQGVMRIRGISADRWAKATEGWKQGQQSHVLED